jgi:hypothetical protein
MTNKNKYATVIATTNATRNATYIAIDKVLVNVK